MVATEQTFSTTVAPPMGLAQATDFMLLMEDYTQSYTKLLQEDTRLRALPYAEAAREMYARQIFYGDAYIHAMAQHGLRAEQVVPMCWPLQQKWAAEHGVSTPPEWAGRRPFRWYWTRRVGKSPRAIALNHILLDQMRSFNPRYIWAFSGFPISRADTEGWRPHAEKLLLWWSCPLQPGVPYNNFDIIFSCIQPLVEHFRSQGIRAAYIPHAFDARVLDRVPTAQQRVQRVAFVGSLTRDHAERVQFLDALSRRVPIDFYGRGVDLLPEDSPLRANYRGPAWGDDLYKVYGSHLLVIHKNIGVAGNAASAKRLFEATGMGACLVAEDSADMPGLFEPGSEIVTYSGFESCVDAINQLLANPLEAQRIGANAQRRTLREHSYARRVEQVVEHIDHV